MQAPRRTTVRGPAFIRLLARLSDVDAAKSTQSLPDRLSQWLDWNHAIALSTALDGKPSPVDTDAPAFGSAVEDECARTREALATAIAGDRELGTSRPRGVEVQADYAVFRQRYFALQRSIQASTGALRGRLRDMLSRTSEPMARLAEVDAVMELALSPREQKILASVPALMEKRFDRLRRVAQEEAVATLSGGWLDVFRKDMQSVLLAELDVRFQPVEALLAALSTS